MVKDYETPPLPWAGDPARTCPFCGLEEATGQLLETNHAHKSVIAERMGVCLAMDRTRVQVLRDAQCVLDARVALATARLIGGSAELAIADRDLKETEAALQRGVGRVREVWPDPQWLPGVLAQLAEG